MDANCGDEIAIVQHCPNIVVWRTDARGPKVRKPRLKMIGYQLAPPPAVGEAAVEWLAGQQFRHRQREGCREAAVSRPVCPTGTTAGCGMNCSNQSTTRAA